MLHSSTINVIAWVLAVSGAIAFLAATAGVVYCIFSPGDASTSVDTRLHDTYYVIRHSRFIVWPYLLCMCLSAAVMIFGYMYTNMHIKRLMRSPLSSNAQI